MTWNLGQLLTPFHPTPLLLRLLRLHFSVGLDVDVIIRLKGVHLVIRKLDTVPRQSSCCLLEVDSREAFDQGVFVLDRPALCSGVVLGPGLGEHQTS